jgi:hypothetical protein
MSKNFSNTKKKLHCLMKCLHLRVHVETQLAPYTIHQVVKRIILVMDLTINLAMRRLSSITKMRNLGSSKKLSS